MPTCPKCQATRTVKSGHIHTGRQRYLCRQCGYQFVRRQSPQPHTSLRWIALCFLEET
ncbi:MAG: IS1 family transposase [Leptolyngbyaceae cyanobacterium T60_A2020_046]|nr:IS1 family transposase [Leptolyngbyaceae cyanobacterium T60_A2020_046]